MLSNRSRLGRSVNDYRCRFNRQGECSTGRAAESDTVQPLATIADRSPLAGEGGPLEVPPKVKSSRLLSLDFQSQSGLNTVLTGGGRGHNRQIPLVFLPSED